MTSARGGAAENPGPDEIRAVFAADAPLTVGVEEELMLLDPRSLDLAPRSRELLERLDGDERFKLEMPAAQIEIMSPPLRDAGEAHEMLAAARRDLAAAGEGLVRFAGAGVHPFAHPEGELNTAPRYERTLAEFGRIARRQLVFGLQVHVAVRGEARALAVYNGLRNHLPELLALAANAPFYCGEDSGLATVRPKLCELLPRQGVPPALESWEAFADELAWGARAGAVPQPGVWWWELRPHLAWGTLEVRVPDAQATAADGAAIVAVVHALAARLARRHDDGEPIVPAPTWRLEENRWRAVRHGTDGRLADLETGEEVSTRERLTALLDELAPDAAALGGAEQLEWARALVAEGAAVRQRRGAGRHGARGAAAWLADHFLEGT